MGRVSDGRMPSSTPRLPALSAPQQQFNVSPRGRRSSNASCTQDGSHRRPSPTGRAKKKSVQFEGESLEVEGSFKQSGGPAFVSIEEESVRTLANDKEIFALAKVFHARLGTLPMETRQVGRFVSWLDLFNHMDLDGSGGVDYLEFEWMVRRELGVRPSSLPDPSLRMCWNALNTSGSGAISFGEFGHFMRYCAKGARSHVPSSSYSMAPPRPFLPCAASLRSSSMLSADLHR